MENKEEDIKLRIEAFKKDYQELIKKHQVDLLSYPVFMPTPTGTFQVMVNTQIADTKYLPQRSELQTDKDIFVK